MFILNDVIKSQSIDNCFLWIESINKFLIVYRCHGSNHSLSLSVHLSVHSHPCLLNVYYVSFFKLWIQLFSLVVVLIKAIVNLICLKDTYVITNAYLVIRTYTSRSIGPRPWTYVLCLAYSSVLLFCSLLPGHCEVNSFLSLCPSIMTYFLETESEQTPPFLCWKCHEFCPINTAYHIAYTKNKWLGLEIPLLVLTGNTNY